MRKALLFVVLFTPFILWGCPPLDPCAIAPELCTPAPPATAYDCAAPPAALKGIIKVKNPVPNSYIVVMKKSGTNALAVQDIQAFSAKFAGLSSVKTLRSVNGFSALITDATLVVKLARDPQVQYVQQNRKLTVPKPQAVHPNDNPTWGIDRIAQRALTYSTSTKRPIRRTPTSPAVSVRGSVPLHLSPLEGLGKTTLRTQPARFSARSTVSRRKPSSIP